ncbi:MAG TPA: hypothetical protein VEX68_27240 [Bryobacteraceae bacterium]|nr:hypothetical protein [Bryobacteraceae bacterium]
MPPQTDSQPPEPPPQSALELTSSEMISGKRAGPLAFAWRTPASDRALVAIVALLMIAAVTIVLLSSPAEREIYIKGELSTFHLPQAVDLDLGKVNSIHLRGIDMKFSRVSSLQLRDPRLSLAKAFSGELSITGSMGQPPASVTLRPVGRRGPFRVLIPKNTVVSAGLIQTSKSLSLKHVPPERDRVRLSLQSDSIDIVEANRVTIRPPISWSLTAPSSPSLVLSNEDVMVTMESVCSEECSIELPSTAFSYLQDGGSIRVDQSRQVTLKDFRASSVMLRGVKEPDMNTVHPSLLEFVTGRNFSWIAIHAGSGGGVDFAATIGVTGRGTVTSLRQDGREVLPSRAADLIAADPARRGVYGGAALLLVFAWGVLFNRAVDIIAKILLPE